MSIFQLSTKLLDKGSPVWSWLENVLRFTTKGWVHWKLVTITIAIILMFYRSTSRRATSLQRGSVICLKVDDQPVDMTWSVQLSHKVHTANVETLL